MDYGTERSIYELNTEKVRARTRTLIAITICAAIVAILYIFLNRPQGSPSTPRMSVDECKTLCGERGIRRLTDDGCLCVEPPETARIPLHCICQ